MKAIILAGGNGTRLNPLTSHISKQCLPVYNRPIIYYPLSTLKSAGFDEVIFIHNSDLLVEMVKPLPFKFTFLRQNNPGGIAEAFLIAENLIEGHDVCLILGDNLFFDFDLYKHLSDYQESFFGAKIFEVPVSDPNRYGVVIRNQMNHIKNIIEKPTFEVPKRAIPGIYFYDSSVIEKTKKLQKSPRNELEITDLNKSYLKKGDLDVVFAPKATWFDVGTFDSLLEASNYVQAREKRTGESLVCF